MGNQAPEALPSLIRADGTVMEDFGELPEGDQGQFEGHRTFRALEAHADTSLAGRQENGGVHAEAPDFASDLHQDGGVGEWQNGIFGVSWHGVSLGAGNTLRRPHEWLPWEAKSSQDAAASLTF
jgi:hypothetical protein